MAKTHFSGPLEVGGKQLTGNAAVTSLTDNTGGAADDTLAAVPSDTLANAAAVSNANFADLAAKVNAILTTLRNAGIINP